MFTSRKPNVNKMQVFGRKCFAYVQHKKKLDERCKEGQFVGFDISSPSYLVYFPDEDNVRRVRCVEFGEEPSLLSEGEDDEDETYETEIFDKSSENKTCETEIFDKSTENEICKTEKFDKSSENETCRTEDFDKNAENETISSRYPKRNWNPPKRYGDYEIEYDDFKDCVSKIENASIDYCYKIAEISNSYHDAISSTDLQHWKTAIPE